MVIVNSMNFLSLLKQDHSDWLAMAMALWPEEEKVELEQVFNDLLSLEHYKGYLCRSDSGEALGFIYLSLRRDYVEGSESSPVGYIEGIYVKPEFRNQGIARKLSALAEAWAAERGCTEIASDTYESNLESQAFHKRIGFQETEKLVHFIKPIEHTSSLPQ